MSRKSSLIDISKAYEQVLNEMNVGNGQDPQNVLIKNAMPMNQGEENNEIEFVQKTPEQMQQVTSQMDSNREKCSTCENGGCEDEDYDPNLDMAKSEIYNIFKSSEKLMHLMKKSNKMEAWMLSKIIKASDYISSVTNVLEYDEYEKEVQGTCDDFANDMHLITKITSMLNGEGKEVNESILRRIIFNLELIKESK